MLLESSFCHANTLNLQRFNFFLIKGVCCNQHNLHVLSVRWYLISLISWAMEITTTKTNQQIVHAKACWAGRSRALKNGLQMIKLDTIQQLTIYCLKNVFKLCLRRCLYLQFKYELIQTITTKYEQNYISSRGTCCFRNDWKRA